MSDFVVYESGGFRYLAGRAGAPFSNGVAALDGYALTRVRVSEQSLADGFAAAARYLVAQKRPLVSLVGCELRSPAPVTAAAFGDFNKVYTGLLRSNGFITGDLVPIARSNVAPNVDPPTATMLAAFTYATPLPSPKTPARDFVISGTADATENGLIAPGDSSPAGLQAKSARILTELRRRVEALDCKWDDVTTAQIYTGFPIDAVDRALAANNFKPGGPWFEYCPCSPPVIGLDFEIDVRCISTERAI